MGEVFAAENIRTGRPVAVKLLRSDSKSKNSAVARFRREARAAGSINSDHVTQVLDVEEDSEHGIVLVFELLEGESLIDRLKRTGPISFEELHPIIEQVWIGLSDAHKAGIIHRDLKPSNVFLERRPDGQTRVKILDFGISKLPKEMGGETLTEMGQSLGTFSFMPPEQIGKAKTVDHRADIYACTTMIYQALSGQLPYAARNILVMVEMKTKTDARKLADAVGGSVDPRLEEFLSKGLARDASKRFQTAVDALAAWRELRPRSSQSQPSIRAVEAPVALGPLETGHAPGDLIPVAAPERLQIVSETTTDTAATLAIPISQAALGATVDAIAGGRRPQGRGSDRPGPMPNAAPAERNAVNAEADGPRLAKTTVMEGGMAARPLGGTQLIPTRPPAAGAPPPGMAQLQAELPRMYEESTSTGPPSQEKTRVYKPQPGASPNAGGQVAQTPPPGNAAPASPGPTQVPQSALETARSLRRPPIRRRRSVLPLVFGALAFALVGFGVVAMILQYAQTGKLSLPWW
jgi:serine/threonine-protein kinase